MANESPPAATESEQVEELLAYEAWVASWNLFCDKFREAAEGMEAAAAHYRAAQRAVERVVKLNAGVLAALDEEREKRRAWSAKIQAMTWERE